MKRIAITGATGFIGANLTRRLLNEGHDLHLLVSEDYTKWRVESLLNDISIHKIDFQDKSLLNRVMKKIRPDWIFHLAVYGSHSTQSDLAHLVQTNIMGTINLVEACVQNGFEAFVNTGSSSEYGFKDHAASEKERLDPNSHYALTKAFATLYSRHIAHKYHLHMPTLRLFSVYGPYEEPTRFIPALILHGLEGILPPLVSPDVAHDFVYVDDVIDAYVLAAKNTKHEEDTIYNVGTGNQVVIRQAVDIVRKIMNIRVDPEWGTMANRIWDTNTWVADNYLIKKNLSWRPNCDFETGFCKTLAWFRDNPVMLDMYKTIINKKEEIENITF